MNRVILFALLVCTPLTTFAWAESVRGIDMEFVAIGQMDNAADSRVMLDGSSGYGDVSYGYCIGTNEVTNAQWDLFVSLAGTPTGTDSGYSVGTSTTGALRPTTGVSWFEAAQFCNFLTSGDKSQGAYLFSGTNAAPGAFQGIDRAAAEAAYDTVYYMPTEDEWYKAAYYNNGYSLYANGQTTVPAADNGWNYFGGTNSAPWNVGSGATEQNGTVDMMGNVWEWTEQMWYGSNRILRGGSYSGTSSNMQSVYRYGLNQSSEYSTVGFRVAFIPEPCSMALLALGGLALLRRK